MAKQVVPGSVKLSLTNVSAGVALVACLALAGTAIARAATIRPVRTATPSFNPFPGLADSTLTPTGPFVRPPVRPPFRPPVRSPFRP